MEPVIGFSRAVRVGNHVFVAGTAPISAGGKTEAPGDVYLQSRRCFEIIAAALSEAGAGIGDVARTRILLTDIKTWREAARAHAEYFADVRPVTTFVQVTAFIDPEWLVEIEVDAVIPSTAAYRAKRAR